MSATAEKNMKRVIAVLGCATLVGLGWFGSSMAQLNLRAAPLVCASGFASNGNDKGYTCTSQTFKCGAGKSVLLPQIVGSKARYTCGFPQG
jgi:hypothetical protein